MSSGGLGDAGDTPKSAGAHVYKEIVVKIYPWPQGGQVVVSARQRRGADLVVDRRLGLFGFAPAADAAAVTTAGILRSAAAAIAAAADKLEGLA